MTAVEVVVGHIVLAKVKLPEVSLRSVQCVGGSHIILISLFIAKCVDVVIVS